MCMAKFVKGQLFECSTLKKTIQKKNGFEKPTKQKATKISREYSFNITKASKIFDQLFGAGQLKLPGDHKLPTLKEIAGN